MSRPFTFYEFFAGGGMARLGLGERWRCVFANDFDPLKAQTYRANFEGAAEHFREGDVWKLTADDLPGRADLAWASSPCQDLSLAGARAGLDGGRSSAFWGFWRLIEQLAGQGRAPETVVIENVAGLATSNSGRDFAAVCEALAAAGYWFGALHLDAAAFVPQSRPRLFIVASRQPPHEVHAEPSRFHSAPIVEAAGSLTGEAAARWLWWPLPEPPLSNAPLTNLLEPDAEAPWRSAAATGALLGQLSSEHRRRLEMLKASGLRRVGAVYRRMRVENDRKVQRAEVRFDGFAGCLRTPRGGSSRQLLLLVDKGRVRSRWLTAREAARLMGLPDDYRLPKAQTAALQVIGDGVAVPVVRHLAAHLLEPLLRPTSGAFAAA
ncbi:MAG TPA: DNA cytosine methyltransferase [Caulobacteraceae bacterium]